jgi:uncharacterized repeat protein (TIGR03806 family)
VGGQALNREVGSFAALPHMVVQNGWPTVAWQEWQSNDFMLSKVWVRRYNGNDLRLPGLENRASSAGCRLDPSADLMLSQTGCFDSLGIDPVAMAGLVPFDLNSHLWSDGALKRRWLVIPDGQTITRTDTGGWSVPVGTMVVKEFALNMVDGDATSRRPVETRFLVKDDADNNWSGYSYQWNESFTDAMLLPGAPETKDWMITTSDGGTRNHTHTYPGRGQCLTCHNLAAGILLGVQSKQLDRRLDYDGIADNQLEAMDRIGMFSAPLDNLPSDPVIPPSDLGFPREPRMRAYLATNCAHCHSPGGIRPTRDFRWETVLDLPGDDPAEASTRMCGSDAEIVPGNAAGSLLFQRMSTRPTGGMPPLATLIVDPFALDLIGSWINGVTAAACP